MTTEEARAKFNEARDATTDPEARSWIELAREYFCDPEFRVALGNYYWETEKKRREEAGSNFLKKDVT